MIAYGSKVLSAAETRSYYLHGADFWVLTDHKPLREILNEGRSAPSTRELHAWRSSWRSLGRE